MDEILVKAALDMLRESQYYADDARAGAPLGNSVIGSLLSIEYRAPRWATAVVCAAECSDAVRRHPAVVVQVIRARSSASAQRSAPASHPDTLACA